MSSETIQSILVLLMAIVFTVILFKFYVKNKFSEERANFIKYLVDEKFSEFFTNYKVEDIEVLKSMRDLISNSPHMLIERLGNIDPNLDTVKHHKEVSQELMVFYGEMKILSEDVNTLYNMMYEKAMNNKLVLSKCLRIYLSNPNLSYEDMVELYEEELRH